jgi:hypothetical protein
MQASGITVERNKAGVPEYIRFDYKKYGDILRSVFVEKGIVFPVEDTPNKTTLKAIREAHQGKGKSFNSVDELFADLYE